MIAINCNHYHTHMIKYTIMSAIKMYSNDSLGIVMWDHRPAGRFAPHGKICDILRAAIKSRFFADILSLRM